MSSANCFSTNASTETLIAEDWVRHCAISYGLLAGTSLAMNLLLAIVFIKALFCEGKKEFKFLNSRAVAISGGLHSMQSPGNWCCAICAPS